MKAMFDDISEKSFDSDYGLIMPDYTLEEVDSVLKNIYGLAGTSITRLDPFTVDFNEKDRTNPKEKIVKKPKIEEEVIENYEDYQVTNFVEPTTFDIKPSVKSKRKGRTK